MKRSFPHSKIGKDAQIAMASQADKLKSCLFTFFPKGNVCLTYPGHLKHESSTKAGLESVEQFENNFQKSNIIMENGPFINIGDFPI